MSLDDLIRFEPNTLAKATEVDTNFQLLKSEINNMLSSIYNLQDNISNIINNKANINGDPTIPFNVANATDGNHAVNKSLLEAYMGNFVYYIYGLDIKKDISSVTQQDIIVTSGECYDDTKQHKLVLNSDTVYSLTSPSPSTNYNVVLFGNDTIGDVQILTYTQGTTIPDSVVVSGVTYSYHRTIGSLITDSNSHISSVSSFSNTAQQQAKSFVTVSRTLKNRVDLSTILPSNGETYLIWVSNSLSGKGANTSASIETDVFPSTTFNKLDGDYGRDTKSSSLVCVPVSNGRWVKVSQQSTLRGYMRA